MRAKGTDRRTPVPRIFLSKLTFLLRRAQQGKTGEHMTLLADYTLDTIDETEETVLDIERQIGNTPLLSFRRVTRHLPAKVRILAKAEWQNPGGSVKDRAAYEIIRSAEADGRLVPGKTILDSTSGNTGIAYAMIAAAKDYRVKLVLPENVSRERISILRAYDVDLVFTDPLEGSDGAIRAVRELAMREPQRYFYADQYNNPANWQAHYQGTGVEIWRQTAGQVTHFVAGLGTSGTLMGAGTTLEGQRAVCTDRFSRTRFALPRSGRLETYGNRYPTGHL